jgi:hypothetical protein
MLKRLLRARETGDETFAFRHPKNLAWLARHPMLRTKPWFGAFRFEVVVRTMGPVRIAPETDPLEALRMGTLVGSCVSLGGGNEHSGLAVALDANKQVLFMRRPGGAFVARQVVGVSEDDQLVCYPVYPLGSPGPVKDAFLACDEAFARAVGLPLRRVDEGASVVPLLVGHWYEDGLWDRLAEPLSRA